jgi:hypothetical protein
MRKIRSIFSINAPFITSKGLRNYEKINVRPCIAGSGADRYGNTGGRKKTGKTATAG